MTSTDDTTIPTDTSTSPVPMQKIQVSVTELFTLFALGIFIGAAFCVARLMPGFFSLAAYAGLLSLFHALEYLTTAVYQPKRVGYESFLLDHSTEYLMAILVALLEFIVELYMFPRLKSWLCAFRLIGLAIAFTGQAIRTLAMVEAKDNFSHQIAEKKAPGHQLVTTGIYKYMRHPAYTGFFFWSLGTQLMLGNVACLAFFYKVLTGFFEERIKYEEETLVRFFGSEYPKYKSMTWSGFFTLP